MVTPFIGNKDSRRRRRRTSTASSHSTHSSGQQVPAKSPNSPTTSQYTTAMDARRPPSASRTVGNYQLAESLGKGSMGKVKLGVHAVTGEKIAVKIVPRGNLDISESNRPGKTTKEIARELAHEKNRELRTKREAHLMTLLRHPHIVSLRDFMVDSRYFYILMDYVNGGQLLHYIVKRQRLSERRSVHLARQIVSALDYLHRNSIVHRDLKIENILIDKTGRVLKLIDFGLSNLYGPERLLTTYCGSLYFAAPELLRASPYRGPEIDIWSLGVIIFVMVTGAVPFDDTTMQGLHEKIKRGHVNYPAHVSDSCRDLLQRIFVTDPCDRIILADIMIHPWFNEGISSPMRNHMPVRSPISLPLDPDVIEQMAQGLDFGTADEIHDKLELIVRSPVYQSAASTVAASMINNKPPTPPLSTDNLSQAQRVYNDPQSMPTAYHPLVSFYHLTRERKLLLTNPEEQPRSALSHKISVESGLSVNTQNSCTETNDPSGGDTSPRKPFALLGNSITHMNDMSVDYLGRVQRWLRSSVFSKIHLHEKTATSDTMNTTPATSPAAARPSEDEVDDDEDDFDRLPPTPCTPSSTVSTPKRTSFASTRSIISSKFSFRLFLPRRTSTSSFPLSPMHSDAALRDRPLPPLPTES